MPDLTPDGLIHLYRSMVRIRQFEEKVQELYNRGQLPGTTHLCQGQEAVSVGVVSAMASGDVLTNTYRGHGEALALNMPPEKAFAELMGLQAGPARGVGGSMHLADFSVGILGTNAIVGAGLPIAVGAGLSFRMRRETHVALSFCGDGATNIGTFHEALNMAAVWMAPVVFIVVNNLYGEYTPMRSTTPIDDLARRADPFGIPGVIVDGQDVEEVRRVTSEAIDRARSGTGPSLLEMKTYRYRGHSRTDPGKYRPNGELDAWLARDPILILGERLATTGVLSSEEQGEIEIITKSEMEKAFVDAVDGLPPSLEEIATYVYAS